MKLDKKQGERRITNQTHIKMSVRVPTHNFRYSRSKNLNIFYFVFILHSIKIKLRFYDKPRACSPKYSDVEDLIIIKKKNHQLRKIIKFINTCTFISNKFSIYYKHIIIDISCTCDSITNQNEQTTFQEYNLY